MIKALGYINYDLGNADKFFYVNLNNDLKYEAVGWTHALAAWCIEDYEYDKGSLFINGEEAVYDIVFKTFSSMEVLSNKMLAKSLICVLLSVMRLFLYYFLLKIQQKYNKADMLDNMFSFCFNNGNIHLSRTHLMIVHNH